MRDLGNAVVDGRKVRWLDLVNVHPGGERVAVDPDTFAPLLIQDPDGTRWTVIRVASVPLAAAEFRLGREMRLEPSAGRIVSHRRGSPRQAANVLGLPVLGIDRSALGFRLENLAVERLVSAYTRGIRRRPLRATGVNLTYRVPDGNVVDVREARRPLPTYAFSGGLTFAFDPIPPAGKMQLVTTGGGWLGQLQSRGLFVTITGPDADTVVAVARHLRSLGS